MYLFTHYFFSGEGSKIIALYATFLGIGISMGIDRIAVGMSLAVFSSMSSVLTNYSGPVAIMMSSTGYVSSKKWFACGASLAFFIIVIWFAYILLTKTL